MADDAHHERTLVLLRHAKAEAPAPGRPDVERPLAARGRADAAAAGVWLAQHGLLPDVVLCSAAVRTRQTWHDVQAGMTGSWSENGPTGSAPAVSYEPDAYEARPEDLLGLIRQVSPSAATVLLIAHNPGISLLSELLDPLRADPEGLRTSGLVVHRTAVSWARLGRGAAEIETRHTARG
ncbi:histidine phosphatase family protein [Micromonospora sp. CP22]|uniref:SixA phosphatase family protein n=1 Tax=Micromonospora sp. CP22 TaxID=2580517 RepID=UPI0012BD8298|nr:histidine phosphatase family protein [Micromonospora sp. CP22]MTK02528.1 histidine phosphatase family protein [Micromonospora sp. CP22]